MGWLPVTRAEWSATGLPDGMSIDATTGTLSGKPTTAGTYAPVIRCMTNWGAGERPIAISVTGRYPPVFTTNGHNFGDRGNRSRSGISSCDLKLKYNTNDPFTRYTSVDESLGITFVEWEMEPTTRDLSDYTVTTTINDNGVLSASYYIKKTTAASYTIKTGDLSITCRTNHGTVTEIFNFTFKVIIN